MHGDCSATFVVGEVDEATRRLVDVTAECLRAGIAAVRPGGRLREIGRSIQAIADGEGFGVVKELVGHGIGEEFHSPPYVHHYDEPRDRTRLRPGMVFTIEPMLTLGSPDVVQWDDGWTIVTLDGQPSAQFEHTVLVTRDGVEVLTG
jgi:methionyl aminopeptidase